MAAWGSPAFWDRQPYRYDGSHDRDDLRSDLIRLAKKGYRFYDVLINRLAGGEKAAEHLQELMRIPGQVQIALRNSSRHIIPAAMIYDYGFDTALPDNDITLCPAFLAALDGRKTLHEHGCFQGDCPSRGKEDVICPSGFWGFRHDLGMPVSIAKGPDTPPEIVYRKHPEITISVSTDPALIERPAHEAALHALTDDSGWHYADTRDKTIQLMQQAHSQLVYFYCHGGLTSDNIPYILVGDPAHERGITRDNLRFYKIRWDTTRPLVFINGCHTTAVEPEQALNLVSGFIENAHAAGVIGTEITVFEPLARAFAEACLPFFFKGHSIGKAIRLARLQLLSQENPLGLVYIPFVLAGLHTRKENSSPPSP